MTFKAGAVACVLLTLIARGFGQDPGRFQPGAIEGYVMERTTGVPLAGIRIRLDGVGIPMKTNSAGVFILENVAPGSHVLELFRPNTEEVRRSDRVLVNVLSGERLTNVAVRMSLGGVTGRVVDNAGSPVGGASVQLFRYDYMNLGQSRLPHRISVVAEGSSNDEGRFDIVDAPPGEYLVLVSPRASSKSGPSIYPGTRRLDYLAERIAVRSGQTVTLRDIALDQQFPGWIHARIVNSTGEELSETPPLTIAPVGWEGDFGLIQERNATPTDREFRPYFLGMYELRTTVVGPNDTFVGSTTVDYSGANLDVEVTLVKPQGRLNGRVLIEPSMQPAPEGAYIQFWGRDHESAVADEEGNFQISGIWIGDYQLVRVSHLPENHYLASAFAGGADALRSGLNVTESGIRLDISLRADAGKIDGRLVDNQGKAVHDALIALIPQGALLARKDLLNTHPSVRSDQDGVFGLQQLIPGDYLLYAWWDAEEGAQMDSAFVDRFMGRGLPVHVEPNGHLNLDVTVLDE